MLIPAWPELDAPGGGKNFAIRQTALNYYPSNSYIHAVNNAVRELAVRGDPCVEAVRSIVVHTVYAAKSLVCEPIEQKRSPKVMTDAQFSVPSNVTLGLISERVSFVDVTPQNIAAAEVRGLMHLTTCRVGPAFEAPYPAAWPARVEINLTEGRTLRASTKGDPRNPLSQAEVIARHRGTSAGIVDHQTDDAIPDLILHVEITANFTELPRVRKGFVLQ